MFHLLQDRNNRYCSSLLYFIVVCILVVCTADERAELKKLTYAGPNPVGAIVLPGNGLYDLVPNEITGYSAIKRIVLRKPAAGKAIGSGEVLSDAVTGGLFIFVGTCVLFLLYFNRHLTTSHHFIIAYIHNLDGMKP